MQLATFAGGCFWCMASPFEKVPGIKSRLSGYASNNPRHIHLSSKSDYYEAVQISFDPYILPYVKLLKMFWSQIDPTDPSGQFEARGDSYRTAIFYHNEEQRILAEKSREYIEKSKLFSQKIVTEIMPATFFHIAEKCHQNYHKNHKEAYQEYRKNSGRDNFITRHWGTKHGKENLEALQRHLTQSTQVFSSFIGKK